MVESKLYLPLLYSGGFCTVALMQESLFRSSYQLAVVGPLEHMTDIFVVVIVKTRDKEGITAGSGTGVHRTPDRCKDVPGEESNFYKSALCDKDVFTAQSPILFVLGN